MQMVSTWQGQTHTVTGFAAEEQQELTDCHNSARRTSEWSVNQLFYANAMQCTEKVCTIAVHLLSCVWLFVTPWTAACQASLSFTNSWSLLRFMYIESMMLSNHLIFCCPLLLLPSIFPSIWVSSNELALRIRWPECWSFSISPSNEYSGWFPLVLTVWTPCCPRDSQEYELYILY